MSNIQNILSSSQIRRLCRYSPWHDHRRSHWHGHALGNPGDITIGIPFGNSGNIPTGMAIWLISEWIW